MKWLKKFEYKTWVGELCGNTFSLLISLAFISFLTIATEGSLIAIAATSFLWSWRARWNPFRSGFLPSLISSSILLGGYVLSGKEMMTPAVMAALFFGNLLMISFIAAVFSGLGTWIRNSKIKKDTNEKNRLEKSRAQFSENLRRIAIIVLFFYVQMFVVVPFAAKVSAASTSQTSDEFIKNYDPDTKYTIKTKAVDEPVKRRIPLESPYANVTGSELEQLEAYCKANGCNLVTVGGELSKLRLNGPVSMEAYMGELNKTYAPKPPVVSWTDSLILPQVAKAISDKLSGKKAPVKAKSKAKPDTRPWYQKAWSGVKGAYDAYQNFDHAFSKKVFEEPVMAAWNFAKAHPFIAAGIVVAAATAIFWAPAGALVAAVALPVGVIFGGIAALGLAKAYHDDGWNGVKNNVISKETLTMWNSGDKAGALGRGTAEVLGKALELLPLAEAPTVAVNTAKAIKNAPKVIKAAIEGAPAAISFIKSIPNMRVGIGIVVDKNILNTGAIQIVKTMVKSSGVDIAAQDAMRTFLRLVPSDKYAIAALNDAGKDLQKIESIAGVNHGPMVEKKAAEFMKDVGAKPGGGGNTNPPAAPIAENPNYTPLNHTPLAPEHYREMPLDWSGTVRKTGQSRIEHVDDHGSNDLEKPLQGVFHKDPIKTTNYVWSKKGKIKPITDPNSGNDVYHIPYRNAGFQGGINGTYENLDYVTIVTKPGTNEVVSSFPSYGNN